MTKRLSLILLLSILAWSSVSAQCDPRFSGFGFFTSTTVNSPATATNVVRVGDSVVLWVSYSAGLPSCGGAGAGGNIPGAMTFMVSFPPEYGVFGIHNVVPDANSAKMDWMFIKESNGVTTLVGVTNQPYSTLPTPALKFIVTGFHLPPVGGDQTPRTVVNTTSETDPPITDDDISNNIPDPVPLGLLPALVLPVTLTTFTAERQHDFSVLKWSTSQEINSEKTDVFRSGDGINFTSIGEVKAAGFSDKELNYSFTDNTPLQGANYYKLKMIDKDGTSKWSSIQTVRFELGSGVDVFPNPVTTTLKVTLNSQGKSAGRLFDSQGVLVKTVSLSEGVNSVDCSRLPSGTYSLSVINAKGETSVHKVIVFR